MAKMQKVSWIFFWTYSKVRLSRCAAGKNDYKACSYNGQNGNSGRNILSWGQKSDLKICPEAETIHPKMTICPLYEQALGGKVCCLWGSNWHKNILNQARIKQTVAYLRGEVAWLWWGQGREGQCLWGLNWLINIQKRSKIKQNVVIFEGRGCVTLSRTKVDKIVAFGGQLTQKYSKTVKN